MPKYRKKPVEVKAEQFFVDKKPWPEDVELMADGPLLDSVDGWVPICDGDWSITDEDGWHTLCKPDIFEQTYEPVSKKDCPGCQWKSEDNCSACTSVGYKVPEFESSHINGYKVSEESGFAPTI